MNRTCTSILLGVAMAVSIGAQAQTGKDTTVVIGGRRVVVTTTGDDTRVAVYDSKGGALRKTAETTYTDEQEVERVYVTSPFLPSSYDNAAGLAPVLPTVWYAYGSTDNKIGSAANSTGGLHVKGSGSTEVGVTIAEGVAPLTRRSSWGLLGLSMASQVYWTWQSFQPGVLVQGEGSHVSYSEAAEAASTNRLSYGGVRIPVMLVWNPMERQHAMASQIAIGLSADVRMGGKYRFTPSGMGDPIERGFKVNTFGLNVESAINFGPIVITGRVGLLPIFKTTQGKKAYTSSIGIGVNIGQIFGRR